MPSDLLGNPFHVCKGKSFLQLSSQLWFQPLTFAHILHHLAILFAGPLFKDLKVLVKGESLNQASKKIKSSMKLLNFPTEMACRVDP